MIELIVVLNDEAFVDNDIYIYIYIYIYKYK